MQETWVLSLGWEDPLEKEMATHSSILAWRNPCIEKPCRLQSRGSQRVGHDWATSFSLEHSSALPFFRIGMKTDLFQSCGHCWVSRICWYVECSTFIASSLGIWNNTAWIPSPPLALFVVMLPKAHLTLHTRISGSRWVVRKHLTEGFLCAVLDLSGILCSLLILEYLGIKRRGKPLPGLRNQAFPSLVFLYSDKYPLPFYEPYGKSDYLQLSLSLIWITYVL